MVNAKTKIESFASIALTCASIILLLTRLPRLLLPPVLKPNSIKKECFLTEYIDYHLSPEPPVTTSPNLPRILAPVNPLNVTAQLGSPVSLHCLVRNLQDKTVRNSMHKKNGYMHVLFEFSLHYQIRNINTNSK